jgi:spermidine synthase
MAEGFKHPRAKVHVGDGFKFLDEYKNAFDVIITDSSDPEGPAESLFQKPYFELLYNALKPGGVITTQGCMSLKYQESSRTARGWLESGIQTASILSNSFPSGARGIGRTWRSSPHPP